MARLVPASLIFDASSLAANAASTRRCLSAAASFSESFLCGDDQKKPGGGLAPIPFNQLFLAVQVRKASSNSSLSSGRA